jgi:hypothetical protein
MTRTTTEEHEPTPNNSTFASRAAARRVAEAGQPPARRVRSAMRAGIDAEADFTITDHRRSDSVQRIRI